MSTTCQKAYSISIGASQAPCSVFEPDDTLFGVQSVTNQGAGSTIQWAGLGIGFYEFIYQSGAFKLNDTNCPAFSEAAFCVSLGTLSWQTDNSDLSPPGGAFFLDQSGNSFANCGGGVSTGFMVQTDAENNFAAAPNESFGNTRENANTVLASITSALASSAADPQTVSFDLKRTFKLVAPQPDTLQIDSLATFASSGFKITYGAETTLAISVTANAATVQGVLNAMNQIIADGGVVCAGTLAAGMTVTWNNNGARALLNANISSISPGIIPTVDETVVGDGVTQEVQTLTIGKICSGFISDAVLPQYPGDIGNRVLYPVLQWSQTTGPNPAAPTYRICDIQFVNSYVGLACGPDAPSSAPSVANGGAGNIEAGTHLWAVSFTNSGLQYNTQSGIGPSVSLVLGANSQVNLSNIPIGPAGTTARHIYRTRAGLNEFRLVGTIGDNVTTVFNDNVADASIQNPANPVSHFWTLLITGVFTGPSELQLWAGYKAGGNDPTGTYTVLPNYYDDIAGTCGDTRHGTQQITLTGTF